MRKTAIDLGKHQFAIKVESSQHPDLKIVYTPMVKRPGLFNAWERIVKVYDHYYTMDIPAESQLTHDECIEHIDGYKSQLIAEQLSIKQTTLEIVK